VARLEVEPPRGRVKDLLAPDYRRMTLVLFVLSFVNCFAYYGLLIVTPSMPPPLLLRHDMELGAHLRCNGQ